MWILLMTVLVYTIDYIQYVQYIHTVYIYIVHIVYLYIIDWQTRLLTTRFLDMAKVGGPHYLLSLLSSANSVD